MKVLTIQLQQLRNELPRGYSKTVAEQLGVHASTVRNVAFGRTENLTILEALTRLAGDHQHRREELNKAIENLKQ
jgi:hypothetical protein